MFAVALVLGSLTASAVQAAQAPPTGALGVIEKKAIQGHVAFLASPELEGRDSPSVGQTLAAEYICDKFRSAGFTVAQDNEDVWKRVAKDEPVPAWSTRPQGGTFLRPFRVEVDSDRRGVPHTRPDAKNCALILARGDAEQVFEYGADFVPLPRCGGECSGELVFAGFGIRAKKDGYDDLNGLDLEGKIALIIEGEPNHKRKFKGPEITALASVWNKVAALEERGAVGVLIMRRPFPERRDKKGGAPPTSAPLSYRYTYASFNPPDTDRWRDAPLPALEISAACAEALCGKDIGALAERVDRSGKPARLRPDGRVVTLNSATVESDLVLNNIVALLPGSDPELSEEVVVVGAHYDHIGVGKRARVGFGADDNASGTSALLQVAQAFKGAQPRRTVLFASFSAEEDGLLGSRELAANLPVPREKVVAMVNLDMLGVGPRNEVFCMGFKQNPGMERLVEKANRSGRTGIRRITKVTDAGLFKRSDHHSFHAIGVPVVFFMEDYPPEKNKDYHTWRDTPDSLDVEEIAATARLAFLTTWKLANDDKRLPTPRD